MRNIRFSRQSNSYLVYINRNLELFRARVDSLEKAVALRDRAIQFFNTHKRFPTADEVGIHTLQRTKSKYGKHISYLEAQNLYRVSIERNHTKLICHTKTLDESQSLKIKILNFYKEYNRLPTYNEIGFTPKRSRRKEGDPMKYISKVNNDTLFVVKITRNYTSFLGNAYTLKEAQSIRDKVLEFYHKNNRLPEREEIGYRKLRSKRKFSKSS